MDIDKLGIIEIDEAPPPLDLVMWPETMFPIRDLLIDNGAGMPRLDTGLNPGLVEDTQAAFRQRPSPARSPST